MTNITKILEKFDEKFYNGLFSHANNDEFERVKTFIRQSLLDILGKIEMDYEKYNANEEQRSIGDYEKIGYNFAIQELKSNLEKIKK